MGSDMHAGSPDRTTDPRFAVGVVVAAIALTVAAVAVQDHMFTTLPIARPVPERLVVVAAAGWAFVLAGTVAHRARPRSGIGRLMVVIGLLWLAKELLHPPLTTPFAFLLEQLALAMLGHVFVTFPSGRLRGWERRAALIWYGWVVLGWLASTPFDDPFAFCEPCAPHLLFLRDDPAIRLVVSNVLWVGIATMALIAVAVVVRRWWIASRVGRREISPLGMALGPILVAAVILPASQELLGGPALGLRLQVYLGNVALMALPVVILVELLRTRLSHARVAELVQQLSRPLPPGEVESVLADTLKDPALRLGFRHTDDGQVVDVAGHSLSLPDGDATRVVTDVAADQTPAVVIHDAAVDPELVRSAVAATGLSLENERLHARVRAQLEELRRSRARLATAADQERRRVERDLHDGAQQRLLTLAMMLDRARTRDDVPPGTELRSELDAAVDEARDILEELRRLARGIYPPELTEHGLRPALESLADRCSLPVAVDVPHRRFPQQVETVVYFVAAEALTNVAKHARAQRARLELAEQDGAILLQVQDDGTGEVDPEGSGLQGLRDRVEAIGGELRVRGVPDQGTIITASLPTHHE